MFIYVRKPKSLFYSKSYDKIYTSTAITVGGFSPLRRDCYPPLLRQSTLEILQRRDANDYRKSDDLYRFYSNNLCLWLYDRQRPF